MRRKDGAGSRTRTNDLLITNQLLYQLSYTGVSQRKIYNGFKIAFTKQNECLNKVFIFLYKADIINWRLI